jgi:plasmid stabilization system protein ParE
VKARIIWPAHCRAVFLELPERERRAIQEKLDQVRLFPRMCAVRAKGRFRRLRYFRAENWMVFYRVIENTVYIRGLWPARMP